MLKRRLLFICFAAALCLGAAPAFADMYGTVDVAYQTFIRGSANLNLTYFDGISSWTTTESAIGLHSLDLEALDDTTKNTDLPSNSYLVEGLVQAFCVDLTQGFPVPISPDYFPYQYDAVSLDVPPNPGGPMGSDSAKWIAQLLNTETYLTADDAAAVQVAIWEIIYESSSFPWDVTTGDGNFYLDTAGDTYGEIGIKNLANDMLDNLTTKASSYSQYTALSQFGKNIQDFVLVPVPAAVLLGVLGLGVVGWKLRKYA